jgi:DNA-binding transcriptional ArsR family regulator
MKEPAAAEVSRVFRALAVEKRRDIVRLLAGRTLCVGALSRRLGVSAGAVSQHLRILRDAGLVEADRQGYFVHYGLAPDADEKCRAVLASLFAGGAGARKGGGGGGGKACRKQATKRK